MKPTFLLGAASLFFKTRKAKVILVGIQFGYLAYKLLKNKNEKSAKRISK